MKIGINFPGFNISAKGLSIQRKRMNLIAENIANADVTRMANGQPYQRKYLEIKDDQNQFANNLTMQQSVLPLSVNDEAHIPIPASSLQINGNSEGTGLTTQVETDQHQGTIVYDPHNPNANAQGYVQESNVNIVTEMVDMISATRSYESNLTALDASKQMVKDSLEI